MERTQRISIFNKSHLFQSFMSTLFSNFTPFSFLISLTSIFFLSQTPLLIHSTIFKTIELLHSSYSSSSKEPSHTHFSLTLIFRFYLFKNYFVLWSIILSLQIDSQLQIHILKNYVDSIEYLLTSTISFYYSSFHFRILPIANGSFI